MTSNHPLASGVDQSGSWPYETMPAHPARRSGDWRLGVTAGGSLVLWPSTKPFPEKLGLIEVVRGEKEKLEQVFTVFCRLGWETDPLHVYQDGTVYLFNWCSYTLAQIPIMGQIIGLFLDGDREAAWTLGRSFGDQIDAAAGAARAGVSG